MSRIYNNQPLQNLPVSTYDWRSGTWDDRKYSEGSGVLLEGVIQKKSRHVIDNKFQKHRYCVLHIKMNRAHRRQFDSSGKEVEPNFSETGKLRIGYLHSSYKTAAKGETDALDLQQVSSAINKDELLQVTQKAHEPGTLAFWIKESQLESLEINCGDEVRLRTLGDSPFIDSITLLTAGSGTVSNFTGGEAVGGSWTDKVMDFKVKQDDKSLPQDQNEGVDEDEWDD